MCVRYGGWLTTLINFQDYALIPGERERGGECPSYLKITFFFYVAWWGKGRLTKYLSVGIFWDTGTVPSSFHKSSAVDPE